MECRQRDLARPEEKELAVVDVIHLSTIGGEESGLLHRALAHQSGRDNRHETVADDRGHRVVDERELEQRALAHDVREPGAARLRGARRVDEAHRLRERGVVERRGRRRLTDDAHDLAVVLAAVGCRHVGRVGHLQPEIAKSRICRLELLLLRGELVLQPARGLDLRRPLAGRSVPDLLAGRVLAGAQSIDLLREQPTFGIGFEHLVDQAVAHTLALDAAAVLRLVPQPLQVDHSVSRTCARSDSTHAAACFHARPAARRRTAPASAGPPTG